MRRLSECQGQEDERILYGEGNITPIKSASQPVAQPSRQQQAPFPGVLPSAPVAPAPAAAAATSPTKSPKKAQRNHINRTSATANIPTTKSTSKPRTSHDGTLPASTVRASKERSLPTNGARKSIPGVPSAPLVDKKARRG